MKSLHIVEPAAKGLTSLFTRRLPTHWTSVVLWEKGMAEQKKIEVVGARYLIKDVIYS